MRVLSSRYLTTTCSVSNPAPRLLSNSMSLIRKKRLNILFDHLNNEDLLKNDTVASMTELAQAIQAKNFEQAQAIHVELMTNKTEECGELDG